MKEQYMPSVWYKLEIMTDVNKQGQDTKKVLQWYMSFTNIGGLSQIYATNLKVSSPRIMWIMHDYNIFSDFKAFMGDTFSRGILIDILFYVQCDMWLLGLWHFN